MNRDLDAEIADALEAEAAAHEITPDAWSRLSERMHQRSSGRRGRWVLVAAALIVTIVVVGSIAVTRIRDDDGVNVSTSDTGGAADCGPGDAWFAMSRKRGPGELAGVTAEVAVASNIGRFRSITEGWDATSDPSFAPDGARLAVVRAVTGFEEPEATEIWSLATDGSKRRQLTAGHLDNDPAWSPDGRQIVFRRWDPETNTDRLMTVSSDGGTTKALLALENRSLQAPSWSPDGTKLAFVAAAPPRSQDRTGDRVWVADITQDNAEPRAVARVPAAWRISWHPNGDSLLVSTFVSEDGTVSRVDIADGTVTRLLKHATQAIWSVDGATAYYLEKPDPTQPTWRPVHGRPRADSLSADRVLTDSREFLYRYYGFDISRCAGTPQASGSSTTTTTPTSPENGATTPTTPAEAPEAGDPATWRIDPDAPPHPSDTTFTALVTRTDCNSGVTGNVLRPGITTTDREVTVTFNVEHDLDGGRCPGNDEVRVVVDVGQRLGARSLRDGYCDRGESTQGSCLSNGLRWTPNGPATNTVSGTMEMVGGPQGASNTPAQGTISASNAQGDVIATAQADADGHFALRLPNGTYHLTGRSPQYDSNQGVCQADRDIVVEDTDVENVAVLCQRK